MREYLVPMLLAYPDEVTRMAPPEGYSAALIDDPPTVQFPHGQYRGPLYKDVAEWRRAEMRSRVARFEAATVGALCAAGVELGRLVLDLDDMERALGNVSSGGVMKPPPEAVELLTRGRLAGCMLLGAVRRWGAMHGLVRSNVERAYFGHLSDNDDRKEAAAVVGVASMALEGLFHAAATDGGRLKEPKPGIFLEWDRAAGTKALVRIENRRKMVLRRL